MDSKRVSINPTSSSLLMAVNSGGSLAQFSQLFPPDVFSMIKESGKIENFSYSNFAGKDWVFVKKAKFNEFSSEEQSKIEQALSRNQAKFILE
jgi:hypothetical protein